MYYERFTEIYQCESIVLTSLARTGLNKEIRGNIDHAAFWTVNWI